MRFWPLLLSLDESELFESILQLILLGVVSVQEFALLLLQEQILFVVFFAFTDCSFFVFEQYWRHQLLLQQLVPVKAFKELVSLHVVQSDTLVRPLVQELVQQVLTFLGDVLWHLEPGRTYAIIKFLNIFCVIWWKSYQKLVENCTNLINISCLANSLAVEHFWR